MENSLYTCIKKAFKKKLPGTTAHFPMAPTHRHQPDANSSYKKAAVLLLLFPSEDSIQTLFIKRNEYDGPHSGQISLPGGQIEAADKSLFQTALREAEEETGIVTRQVELIGQLTPLYIPVSMFKVYPFVGWCNTKPVFNHDPSEVQYLITPKLNELLNPVNRQSDITSINGQMRVVPFFNIHGNRIWGATAMMVNEFLTMLEDCR